jgi:hypothetical protein
VARSQDGLITLAQLRAAEVTHRALEFRIRTERWQRVAQSVICTTTGTLTDQQRLWVGVLHAGEGALVGGIHACQRAGLEKWDREEVVVLVPYALAPRPLAGYQFVRSRRRMAGWRSAREGVPTCRVEPAALLWVSTERNPRTLQGLLAALVQQRVSTPERLAAALAELPRLPRAPLIRATLTDVAGGAQSVSELDVKRMCKTHGLAMPRRQTRRRDADGRVRYTDCEWRLADGRILVLEVDGGFHKDAETWEDDIARQRALSATDLLIVRCTSRELRDDSVRVARDLLRLGVPRAA